MSSAYDAVHRQPGEPLVGPHGGLGGRAETAINGDRGDAALVGAHEVEVELQLPDGGAGGAIAQHARVLAGPQAGRKQAVGNVIVDFVELVPCRPAHDAVAGEAEVGLEPPHGRCGRRAEDAVHGDIVETGIDRPRDLQPELHQPDVLAAAALAQGGAGVALGMPLSDWMLRNWSYSSVHVVRPTMPSTVRP